MPQFTVEIPNSEQTISSSIVVSVLTRVIRTFKWYEDFDFNYSLLGSTWLVSGSEIDLPTQDRSQQRMPTDQKVMVEVNERYNEDAVSATHIRQGVEKNIFECPLTKTNMHPGYQQMIADITLTFRFRSRHSAENFRKRVRLAQTKSIDGMRLEVKYTYIIPYAFLDILNRIYTLMETKHGYGLSLGDWLRQSFTPNLTTLANQSGGKTVLAIAEVNENVVVLMSTPSEIEQKDKADDTDSWTVPITISVHYDRPDVMRLRFQHLINNQFLGMDIANRFKTLKQDYLKARTNMATLEVLTTGDIPLGNNPLSGASSPVFDDWLPPRTDPNYFDSVRIMVMLDEQNFNDVVDLSDLADYELTPPVLAWLAQTHDTVTEFGKNIFWVRVWAWDQFSSSDVYTLSSDLKLTAGAALDPRVNYHVTFGTCMNPAVLDDSVWDLLKQNRAMLDEWLSMFAPRLRDAINWMLIQYNQTYRDTDVFGYFQDPGDYDPTVETTLPDFVISRIRKILSTIGTDGTSYNPSDPYLVEAYNAYLTSLGDPYKQSRDPTRIIENPKSQPTFTTGSTMKTVMPYGVIVNKKGT